MKRFILVLTIVLTIPFATTHYTGFTVYAGHTTTGSFCDCGCPGCICDPGETPTMCMDNAVSAGNGSKGAAVATAPSASSSASSDLDLGSGALMLMLALLMLRRMWF